MKIFILLMLLINLLPSNDILTLTKHHETINPKVIKIIEKDMVVIKKSYEKEFKYLFQKASKMPINRETKISKRTIKCVYIRFKISKVVDKVIEDMLAKTDKNRKIYAKQIDAFLKTFEDKCYGIKKDASIIKFEKAVKSIRKSLSKF